MIKDLSWNEHIIQTASKANKLLGFIKRHSYIIRSKKTLTLLYTSLIRSHFNFASQVWAPQSVIKNLFLIERTKRGATKFIRNDQNMNYQLRLLHLNLSPLNYWLEYLDILLFYKCKSGIVRLIFENYVKYCNSKSRRASSGLYLTTAYFRTSLFCQTFQYLECCSW